jgi:hypothetical protein
MSNNEKTELINKYCNGTASKEESLELEALLLNDAELRREFSDMMNLDAALKEAAETELVFEEKEKAPIQFPTMIKVAAIAIILLLCLNLVFMLKKSTATEVTGTEHIHPEQIQSGVALITKAVDIQGNLDLEGGKTLDAGLLKFDKGLLQVEFFSGATLIIEGPANIQLIDSMNIKCDLGKIRARVSPQAIGFKIITSDMDVVDLGTEFAIDVPENGQSSVYVFEGEVELYESGKGKLLKNLKANDAAKWENQSIQAATMRDDFVSFEYIEALNKDFSLKKFEEWKAYAAKIRQRKDVILFYTFDKKNDWSRTVINESLNQNHKLDGAVVGCRWIEGRWPGKGALEFKSTGDRVKLEIPNSYDDITFSCWVRIEGFDRWLSSLLLTDDYKNGALHWQLSDTGEMILGARSNGNTFSPPVIKPTDLGRWIHVATVYNSQAKEIVHYLNGKPVVRGKIKRLQKITLGKADIGNWSTKHRDDNKIRSLNGRLDELILFSSPLSDADISTLYNQGTPD